MYEQYFIWNREEIRTGQYPIYHNLNFLWQCRVFFSIFSMVDHEKLFLRGIAVGRRQLSFELKTLKISSSYCFKTTPLVQNGLPNNFKKTGMNSLKKIK